VLIGEGQQRPELEALANQLGITHAVIWTGFRKDVRRLLAAMDIFIQSSGNEGLSLGLLEAMAAGKPVIATDVGGTSEVVLDGETGILIPPHSSSAIGAALVDLLDNPEKRSALADAGRAFVVREFDVERMMNSYGRLYQSLLMRT
jgi:glycosyltransferase involved in cell wall biosynthesis